MELIDRVFAGCLVGGLGFAILMLLSAGALNRLRLPVRLPRARWFPRLKLPRVLRVRAPRVNAPELTLVPPGMAPILLGMAVTLVGAAGLLLHAKLQVSATLTLLLAPLLSIVLTSLLAYGLWTYFTVGAGDSEIRGGTPIGKLGHVSVSIPPEGVGAVALIAEGKRVTMPAVAQRGAPLERGADVMVVDVIDHRVVVEAFDRAV